MAAKSATNVMQGELQLGTMGTVKGIITSYTDRVFLNLSTNDRMGTMMLCSKRQRPDGSTVFDCETILGKRDDDAHSLLALAVPSLDTDSAPDLAAAVKAWVSTAAAGPSAAQP